MKRFAALYARLDESRATSAKLAAMREYFADAPAEDAAWALFFLRGGRLKRTVGGGKMRLWATAATGLPAAVVEESYAHVGDLAETVALLFDDGSPRDAHSGALADCVARLQALRDAGDEAQELALRHWWTTLPFAQCLVLNKLLTGELRVGVSAGLANRAIAEHANLPPALIAQRLSGDWQPSASAYQALIAEQAQVRLISQPYPFCLAHPLQAAPATLGAAADWLAEWKYDGIRGQLIRRGGCTFLWSRGEEPLDGRFPEIEAMAERLPDGTVLDGEILAWRNGVLPFAMLQTRIGRKTISRRLLKSAPVRFVAYDVLEWGHADLRSEPLSERRARLEALAGIDGLEISPAIAAADWDTLAQARADARARSVEGLMLKRLDSRYEGGRRSGIWWKWKIDPLTLDLVLVYAQSGHGRRSNLYSDYTLAVRDGEQLLPLAKAYSGLTDAELAEMDRWIRRHTREKFGPVRSVEPLQVFEVAFEGIQTSSRHKSGVALRFPRIARWRRDKPATEADDLATVRALLAAHRA